MSHRSMRVEKALAIALKNNKTAFRYSGLKRRLTETQQDDVETGK